MADIMQEKWPWIEGTHAMRAHLLDTLSDADLTFNPGGRNMTLGALVREIGHHPAFCVPVEFSQEGIVR